MRKLTETLQPVSQLVLRQACAKSTGYTLGRPEDVPHVFTEF